MRSHFFSEISFDERFRPYAHFTKWRSLSDLKTNIDVLDTPVFLSDNTGEILQIDVNHVRDNSVGGYYRGLDHHVSKFAIVRDFFEYPFNHPFYEADVTCEQQLIIETIGSRANCYEDFVAEPHLRFFVGFHNGFFVHLFKSEEDQILASILG